VRRENSTRDCRVGELKCRVWVVRRGGRGVFGAPTHHNALTLEMLFPCWHAARIVYIMLGANQVCTRKGMMRSEVTFWREVHEWNGLNNNRKDNGLLLIFVPPHRLRWGLRLHSHNTNRWESDSIRCVNKGQVLFHVQSELELYSEHVSNWVHLVREINLRGNKEN